MVEISAGDLTAVLVGAELRDVRVAGWPALDAVYVAVRDAAWRTVPGEVCWVRSSRSGESTRVELEVRHRDAEIDFRWRGSVVATPDGLRFTMDGVAEREFDANRVGFCLLHPQSLRGRALHVDGPGGARSGRFPEQISPHQVCTDVRSLGCSIADGVDLDIEFAGDLFETEDHRNWSDPGWKTYCTPLSAPFPLRYPAGRRRRQQVDLRPQRAPGGLAAPPSSGAAELTVTPEVVGTVPEVGVGASGLAGASSAALRAVRPAFLHVELEASGYWRRRLDLAAAEAAELGVPLDVALVAERAELAGLLDALASAAVAPRRLSVFSPSRHVTETGLFDLLVGRPVLVGGGSRAHFAELNRADLDLTGWDFVTYGLTPQVHHSDDDSIVATVAAIPDTLAGACRLAEGRPVVVGPITLRPRFRAELGGPDPLLDPERSGPDVDDRQHGPLAAVYLAGALSALVGVEAVIAYRGVGSRGVVTAGGVLTPAAQVVAAAASVRGAPARRVETSTPELTALAAEIDDGMRLLITNLSGEPRPARVSGVRVERATLLDGVPLDIEPLVLPPWTVAVVSVQDRNGGAA